MPDYNSFQKAEGFTKSFNKLGLVETFVSDKDIVDLNGFSDAIQIVGSKSATFSTGAVMKANVGKQIGISQLKINTAAKIPLPAIAEVGTPGTATYSRGTSSWSSQFIDVDTATVITSSVDNTQVLRIFDTQSSIAKTIDMSITEPAPLLIFNPTAYAYDGSGGSYQAYTKEIRSNWGKTYTVDESDDITFATGVTNIITDGNEASLASINTTKRYFRVTEKTAVTYTTANVFVTNQNGSGTPNTCFAGCGGMTKTARNVPNITVDSIVDIAPPLSQVTVKVRSSVGLDVANGSVIIPDQIMGESEQLVFDTDLLVVDKGQYLTVEIVSVVDLEIPVTLSEITSVAEV